MAKVSKIVAIERLAPEIGANVEGGRADLPHRLANVACIGFAGGGQADRLVLTQRRAISSCASKLLMCRLTALCVRLSSLAARVTLSVLAPASKTASLAVDGRNRRGVCILLRTEIDLFSIDRLIALKKELSAAVHTERYDAIRRARQGRGGFESTVYRSRVAPS